MRTICNQNFRSVLLTLFTGVIALKKSKNWPKWILNQKNVVISSG